MAIRDNKSSNLSLLIDNETVTTETLAYTTSFDGSDSANGITFVPFITAADGATTGTIAINAVQDSDDNSTWANVDNSQYIGLLSDLDAVGLLTTGSAIKTLGVFGTRKYVRLAYTPTLNDSTTMSFIVVVNNGIEIAPSPLS